MKKSSNTYRFLPYIPEPKRTNEWIHEINHLVYLHNQDNISRTMAYQKFFLLHPEIKWSFLASMVSRNAGWNMTDLKGDIFPRLLHPATRDALFMTYERANWSIFQDAFPQLLLYHYSTRYKKKMFHLSKEFHISSFMEEEWNRYWEERDDHRLVHSLIINEQHLIQEPVIDHEVYKKRVFGSSLFFIEDHLHFSSVLFPTLEGELLGASVHGFRKIENRIQLGNRLFKILFQPDYHSSFLNFALQVEHSGSRKDYEQFCKSAPKTNTPMLHQAYVYIPHHWRTHMDWSIQKDIDKEWYQELKLPDKIELSQWYFRKQRQLEKVANIKGVFTKIGKWRGKKKRPTL
ncbi:DUF2515 family protein [Rossellomorea aquimaris]|uniref:DUF2515 family protein n=1 Tax=Rossellomorea aquimaris TaxID=189382 RepID=UPI000698A752|nr:DUF2515 family protein [Rossellomorea aquimaris]